MLNTAEVEKVIDAIDKADPSGDDKRLSAMRQALRFAQGYVYTAEEFIADEIDEI